MRKQLISSFVGLLLVGMGSQGYAQQFKGWQGGAAMPYAQDGLRDWTNNAIWGLCVDGAYIIPIPNGKSSFRPGLGINWLPGSENNYRTISLVDIQINADVVTPIGTSPFSIVTGLSVNTWFRSVSGLSPLAQTVDGINYPAYSRKNSVSGMVEHPLSKLGFRLGLEYALNDRLSVAALFQLAELGTDTEFMAKENRVNTNAAGEVTASPAEYSGKHGVNPAWIQVGVRYKF
ncbi:MAG: hypothetical protein FWG12_04545 [Holophagaceae bacterium]|nr:hypothetical protein [Holophagaceae bacterium]